MLQKLLSWDFWQKAKPLLSSYRIPIILGALGLVFLCAGLFVGAWQQPKQPIEISSQTDNETAKSSVKIVVDIAGAVAHPNVYYLDASSRVIDALVASGGLSGEADREWITKNLNLSAKLTDGTKLYIPKTGESGFQNSGGVVNGAKTTGQIGLNSASISELDTLPGIGPVTAQKIVDGRPYQSIEELRTKKVVTSSVFEKIKDMVNLN